MNSIELVLFLCERCDLILEKPPEVMDKIEKGKAFRIEYVFERLVKVKALPTWINFEMFENSAKLWTGYRVKDNQIWKV